MADLPSMDDILRDSARRERVANRRLGAMIVIGSLAVLVGLRVLSAGSGIALYVMPTGALAFGMKLLVR